MIPKLSIILPSVKSKELYKCIQSIVQNTTINYELFIISDYRIISNLDFKQYIGQSFNGEIIEDVFLDGPVGAINQALPYAKGEYIVTLSDDCLVTPNWASNMISFLEKLYFKNAIGSFRVFDETGELGDIGYYGRSFSLFPFMRRDMIHTINGYYSNEYNAFYSDPDLGIRAWQYGKGVYTCPNAFIYHKYNPDIVHISNKSKYFLKDEEIFRKKWDWLGEWNNCQKIYPNVIDLYPTTLPSIKES